LTSAHLQKQQQIRIRLRQQKESTTGRVGRTVASYKGAAEEGLNLDEQPAHRKRKMPH
jgi:hypothetical protein